MTLQATKNQSITTFYLVGRQAELYDIKFKLMQELEKKFPRPVTNDFLVIAAHMSQIDEEAEKAIKKFMNKQIAN